VKHHTPRRVHSDDIPLTKSSGNVFADMGCDHPEELQVKAELARQIYRRIRSSHKTQATLARDLHLQQPEVSKLANARYTGFSTDRLLTILTALGVNVDITLSPQSGKKKHQPGWLHVRAAA
jgi:predicted XRE-type DNA-binding protein